MSIRDDSPLPHKHSCPFCGWSSNMAADKLWECRNCKSGLFRKPFVFNTFQHGGKCPKCQVVFTYTHCPSCCNTFPYENWIAPYYTTNK